MKKKNAQKTTTVPESPSDETNSTPAQPNIGVDFAATKSLLHDYWKTISEESAAADLLAKKIEKGDSIFTFQEGDVIINVLPKKRKRIIGGYGYSAFWGGPIEIEEPDNRYRQPFRLLGVRNNLIYLRTIKGEGINGNAYLYKVPVDELENGWKLFELPENLTEVEAAGIPY